MSNPERRELDVENIIYRGAHDAGQHTKVRWLDKRMLGIYIFVVIAAIGVLYWGQRTSDHIKDEQIRFEKASVSNCQSVATIVNTFDGYLQAQIEIIGHRSDLDQATKSTAIANYRAHLIQPPDCATLIPQ